MKDYTKCDFDPIIGAEVEFETCLFETDYDGILLGYTDDLILIERASGGFARIARTNIRFDSLKATMKPRDMSPEQLHRLAEEIASKHYGERYESIRSIYHYFDEDGELNDISVDVRCHLPDGGAFVLDPNEPVDVTHWIKEELEQCH